MKRAILGIILVSLIFIIGASGCSPPTCNKPYILVGNACCLDQNDNSICDNDEGNSNTLATVDQSDNAASDNQIVFVTLDEITDGIINQPYSSYSFCNPSPETAGATCGGIEGGTLDPIGGIPPYSFEVGYSAGNLPPGLRLNLNGLLEGTPTLAGTYNFEICAKDGSGNKACDTTRMKVFNAFKLFVGYSGNGGGSFSLSPSNDLIEDCSTESSGCYIYKQDAEVTITPKPDIGSKFTSWAGDCQGSGSCTLSMDSDKSITVKLDIDSILSGNWAGQYSEYYVGGIGGCTFSDNGAITMSIDEAGGSIGGSFHQEGLEVREIEPATCKLTGYIPASSSISGSISGNQVTITSTSTIDRVRDFVGVLEGDTFSGKILSPKKGGAEVGTFSLQRQ